MKVLLQTVSYEMLSNSQDLIHTKNRECFDIIILWRRLCKLINMS